MYKMILINFDENLIDQDDGVKKEDIILLDQIKRKKIRIGLLTSRCFNQLLYYNQDFIFTHYIIASNYSYLYDLEKEKLVDKHSILISKVKKIINLCQDTAAIYLVDDQCWNLINEDKKENRRYDCIKIDDTKQFLSENKSNIYKIELYFKNNKELNEKLIQIETLDLKLIIRKTKNLLEITSSEANIENVVEKLSQKEKIKEEEIIVVSNKIKQGNYPFKIVHNQLENIVNKLI